MPDVIRVAPMVPEITVSSEELCNFVQDALKYHKTRTENERREELQNEQDLRQARLRQAEAKKAVRKSGGPSKTTAPSEPLRRSLRIKEIFKRREKSVATD